MNTKKISAISLSFINLIASLFFIPIWAEYLHAIFSNQLNRLESNNIFADVVIMLLSLIFFILSIVGIAKYFRYKNISPLLPGIIFVIYIILFVSMFLTS
jgi:amino acid transporter